MNRHGITDPEYLVFPFNRKTADNWMKKYWKMVNIPEDHRHCHVFRHSHAIHMLNAGIPITIVSRRLGHTSIITTARFYLRYNLEAETKLLEKLWYKEITY